MNKQKNTIRFIYSGTMLVLNQSERFALAGYFYKRNMDLTSKFIIYKGDIFYKIEKEISQGMLIATRKLAA